MHVQLSFNYWKSDFSDGIRYWNILFLQHAAFISFPISSCPLKWWNTFHASHQNDLDVTENIFLVVLAGVYIFVTKHSIAANIGKSLKEVEDFMELLTSYWLCQALCKPGLFNSVLYERCICFSCTGLYFFFFQSV